MHLRVASPRLSYDLHLTGAGQVMYAKVNLSNFLNGYQVATCQKTDGATQWLDSFVIHQNGYLKTPQQGVWVSWGWSYELPVEVEGSRRYTLEPFSKLDVYELPLNALFEGPSRLIND